VPVPAVLRARAARDRTGSPALLGCRRAPTLGEQRAIALSGRGPQASSWAAQPPKALSVTGPRKVQGPTPALAPQAVIEAAYGGPSFASSVAPHPSKAAPFLAATLRIMVLK
jgi:hypothetical protein